jgi:tryptophan 2,3-dioxygenase
MDKMNINEGVYYGDYLQLDKIINAQTTESGKAGDEKHDEMLFIVIHQAYELWFKLIIYELKSMAGIISKPEIDDFGPDLNTVVHRMKRVNTILKVLVQQVDIIETMTPLDFLDFRNMLRPASGFQSVQFKIVEAMLGLRLKDRHGKAYYLTQLREEDKAIIAEVEKGKSFIMLLNEWLERMPFLTDDKLWQNFNTQHPGSVAGDKFWNDYKTTYTGSLTEQEKGNIKRFDQLFNDPAFTKDRKLSHKANRSALFIMLYRDYPVLYAPYQILNALLDIDEHMATWRFRHINMVHRMIGTRVGTGGSSGKDYLQESLNKHYIFKEIAELTSFLIERRNLPELSSELKRELGSRA